MNMEVAHHSSNTLPSIETTEIRCQPKYSVLSFQYAHFSCTNINDSPNIRVQGPFGVNYPQLLQRLVYQTLP